MSCEPRRGVLSRPAMMESMADLLECSRDLAPAIPNAAQAASLAPRPRVVFINRSYWPDVEATGQLLTELCEDLAAEFDVHVICGQPRQVAGDASFARRGRSVRRGVTIHRVRHTQFDKASFWGRVANMLSFQAASAWAALRTPRPQIVVTETDPPFLCLLGSLAKRLRGSRHVCYLQDIYPDVAVALAKLRDGVKTRQLRQMFLRAYARSDAVVVLSRDMREQIVDGGVPAERVHVIPNWVDVDAVHPVKESNRFRHFHALENKFVVMYSGNMGLSQRLGQVLEAAALLRDRTDIVFAMVGDGADRRNLERQAVERGLANVRFFGYQPKAELADSLSAADLHLVVLRPEIKRLLMPSKLYGVLASGTPALVIADDDCELSAIVRENGLGPTLADADPQRLANALLQCAAAPDEIAAQGRRCRAYAVANCSRRQSIEKHRHLLSELTATAKPSAAGVAVPVTS